jgi:hypothetical protein
MSLDQPTPSTRDAALQRRRAIAITAAAGGIGAIGVILGAVAFASGGSAATTPNTTPSSPQDNGSSSGATSPSDSLGTPDAAPTAPPQQGFGGRQPQAVTGGSGR